MCEGARGRSRRHRPAAARRGRARRAPGRGRRRAAAAARRRRGAQVGDRPGDLVDRAVERRRRGPAPRVAATAAACAARGPGPRAAAGRRRGGRAPAAAARRIRRARCAPATADLGELQPDLDAQACDLDRQPAAASTLRGDPAARAARDRAGARRARVRAARPACVRARPRRDGRGSAAAVDVGPALGQHERSSALGSRRASASTPPMSSAFAEPRAAPPRRRARAAAPS